MESNAEEVKILLSLTVTSLCLECEFHGKKVQKSCWKEPEDRKANSVFWIPCKHSLQVLS